MKLWRGFPIAACLLAAAASAQNPCAAARDLRLTNGDIHTMDSRNTVVHEVTIQEGRFAYVGPVGNHPLDPCTRVIDLHGRTVVPGLIDNHNHFILFGLRPGHDIELETANSIPQAMALLKQRAQEIPSGAWVTTIGDWLPRQFAENRDPTLAELDQAVSDHPLLIVPGNGTAVTNSLGKKFFESKGIAVTPDGVIAPGDPTYAAIGALRNMQSFAEQVEGTRYAQSYMLRFGATTSVDMGFFALPGSSDLQGDEATGSIASADPWTAYNPVVALDRDGKLDERIRLFIISQDKDPNLPILKQRLLNTFPDFGDDMLRVSGIGEFASPWIGTNWQQGQRPQSFEPALQLVAKAGWAFQQHASSLTEVQFTAQTYSNVNAVTPIGPLHWSIAHVPTIDPATLQSMKTIGVGLALHAGRYLGGARPGTTLPAGPPFHTVLESGIHTGAGSDAGDFAVLDPWLDLYYIVTGKDVTGALINPGEQVTRDQAMKMYTADNGWFFPGGEQLGSIEPGKLGDLAVLTADYFDPSKVSDDAIKHLESVMTVVGGKIVYENTGAAPTPRK